MKRIEKKYFGFIFATVMVGFSSISFIMHGHFYLGMSIMIIWYVAIHCFLLFSRKDHRERMMVKMGFTKTDKLMTYQYIKFINLVHEGMVISFYVHFENPKRVTFKSTISQKYGLSDMCKITFHINWINPIITDVVMPYSKRYIDGFDKYVKITLKYLDKLSFNHSHLHLVSPSFNKSSLGREFVLNDPCFKRINNNHVVVNSRLLFGKQKI